MSSPTDRTSYARGDRDLDALIAHLQEMGRYDVGIGTVNAIAAVQAAALLDRLRVNIDARLRFLLARRTDREPVAVLYARRGRIDELTTLRQALDG